MKFKYVIFPCSTPCLHFLQIYSEKYQKIPFKKTKNTKYPKIPKNTKNTKYQKIPKNTKNQKIPKNTFLLKMSISADLVGPIMRGKRNEEQPSALCPSLVKGVWNHA